MGRAGCISGSEDGPQAYVVQLKTRSAELGRFITTAEVDAR